MIFNIPVDIYGRDVVFIVEVTSEEFDRFYYNNTKMITDEEYKVIRKDILDKKGIGGATYWLDYGQPLVYLSKGNSDIFVPHEIFHVCNKILCAAGVNHDSDAEPWAYLIGWMTNEYYRKYYEMKENAE